MSRLEDCQNAMQLAFDLLKESKEEVALLNKRLRGVEITTQGYLEELNLYKALATEGAIYVNTYSQDCDGVEAYSSYTFNTIEEYREGEEAFADSVEGSCSWSIVSKEDVRPQDECGTFGQGWGIN
jgi:hypothetical protein